MIQPRHVTFTGLDARTDLTRVSELSARYPIEWGVLMGGRLGKKRYPDPATKEMFHGLGLNLSAHLCGKEAKAFQDNTLLENDLSGFSRIQVNSVKYDMAGMDRNLRNHGIPVIMQNRGDEFLNHTWFDQLQDCSGGRGTVIDTFPKQTDTKIFSGYAGGITPENVLGVLDKINAMNYWIDMETGVRTEDDWLDLDKCEAVCKAIWNEGVNLNET